MISLRSKVTQRVLSYFFTNEEAECYVNELARRLDVDPKNLHIKLLELEEVGLLRSRFSGKQRYFRLNKQYPLLHEYQTIARQTFGLPNELAAALKNIKGINEAFLFGSYAKGTMDQASDIDLMVVGDHSPRAVSKELERIQKGFGRVINVTNISKAELLRRKAAKDPFIKDVFSHKRITVL